MEKRTTVLEQRPRQAMERRFHEVFGLHANTTFAVGSALQQIRLAIIFRVLTEIARGYAAAQDTDRVAKDRLYTAYRLGDCKETWLPGTLRTLVEMREDLVEMTKEEGANVQEARERWVEATNLLSLIELELPDHLRKKLLDASPATFLQIQEEITAPILPK